MTDKLTITFKPKQAVKRLLGVLGDRSQDVLTSRFGLGADTKRMTLEAIGKKYKITRERVRQIENYSLINIRKSKEYTKEKEIFDELREIILNLGSTVGEETLLKHLSKDKSTQNQIHCLLSGKILLEKKKTMNLSTDGRLTKNLLKKFTIH